MKKYWILSIIAFVFFIGGVATAKAECQIGQVPQNWDKPVVHMESPGLGLVKYSFIREIKPAPLLPDFVMVNWYWNGQFQETIKLTGSNRNAYLENRRTLTGNKWEVTIMDAFYDDCFFNEPYAIGASVISL